MPILFAGSSIADFDSVVGNTIWTSNPLHLPADITEGVYLQSSGDNVRKRFDTVPSFWLSYYIYPNTTSGSGLDARMSMGYSDNPALGSSDVSLNGIMLTTFGLEARVFLNNVQKGTFMLDAQEVERIDVRLKNHATEGEFLVYYKGLLVYSFTGNTENVTPLYNTIQFWSNNTADFAYSAIILGTADTRAFLMVSLPISGEGTINEWNGTYIDIDNPGLNKDTFMWADGIGDRTLFTVLKPDIPAGYTVGALVFSAHAAKYGDAYTGVEAIQEIEGTITSLGPINTADIYFAPGQYVVELNPATGVRYTPEEYAAMELGLVVA